ncbi:MAG: hypothetical protein ACK5KL_04695, partial [Dysgonomonas sp.]
VSCADRPDQSNYLVRYTVNSYARTVRVEYRYSPYSYTCHEISGELTDYELLQTGSMAILSLMMSLDAQSALNIIENKDSLMPLSDMQINKSNKKIVFS